MIRILSLGAGVQSTTALLMSCKGELQKLDCAIFADVGWEPKAVYDNLDWLKGESERHGIPVHIVGSGRNIRDDAAIGMVRGRAEGGERWTTMPYFTKDVKGSVGMLRRQCTKEFKIVPIEKFVRSELMGLKPRQRAPKDPVIEQWFGISFDEAQRMRSSDKVWKTHRYPLIYDVPMDRDACHVWLKANYPERDVPRSSCIGCPFHSDYEWRQLRDTSPAEFQDAVELDNAIRESGGIRGKVYIHRKAIPLQDVDLDTMEDKGQINMFGNECEGLCGV